jgi:hypothetical protein
VSSLTWLAHSEAERRRTLDVIKLLEEPGTLDEIGIGGIRDAFAELLFPGTSTIQTRARYFLFIPWLYRELERRAPIGDGAGLARSYEVKLIDALMESDDTDGVIGREARARLKRLPSAVYWQGLETWGIRQARTSLHAYHRRLERFGFGTAAEGEAGKLSGLPSAWHAELPEAPDGFPGQAELALTLEEADYLRDRIRIRCPETLLATLAARPARRSEVELPWEIEEADLDAAPAEVREQIRHAKAFAELIHGAQLLYNLMLAQKSEREEAESYSDRLALWADDLVANAQDFSVWNRERSRFWEIVRGGNPRLPHRAEIFANAWFDFALADPHRVAEDPRARDLISERELFLKKRLARLHNRTALDAWRGVSGAEMLRFRWPQAQKLVADISAPRVAADLQESQL